MAAIGSLDTKKPVTLLMKLAHLLRDESMDAVVRGTFLNRLEELISGAENSGTISYERIPSPDYGEVMTYAVYEQKMMQTGEQITFPHEIEIMLKNGAKMRIKLVTSAIDVADVRSLIKYGYAVHGENLAKLKYDHFNLEEKKVTFIVTVELPKIREGLPVGTLSANIVDLRESLDGEVSGVTLTNAAQVLGEKVEGGLPNVIVEYGNLSTITYDSDGRRQVGIYSNEELGITAEDIAQNMLLGISHMVEQWIKMHADISLEEVGQFALMQFFVGDKLTKRYGIPLDKVDADLAINVDQHGPEISSGTQYWYFNKNITHDTPLADLPRITTVVKIYYNRMIKTIEATKAFWLKRKAESTIATGPIAEPEIVEPVVPSAQAGVSSNGNNGNGHGNHNGATAIPVVNLNQPMLLLPANTISSPNGNAVDEA